MEGVDLDKECTHREYLEGRHEGTLREVGPGHACQNFLKFTCTFFVHSSATESSLKHFQCV